MSFVHASDAPVRLANKVGIAIKLYCADIMAMHVGLIFESAGVVRMAHLGFHEQLRCDPLRDEAGYAWADCLWLQDPDHAGLADYVRLVIKSSLRNDKVHYGLEPDLDSFSTGQFVSRHPLLGLTCATYVVAALRAAGFDVLDIATWRHRPGDDEWSEQVLEELRRRSPRRAVELQGQKARFRVRPDEVAFAAAEAQVPVTFEEAVAGSVEVRTLLVNGPSRPRDP